MDQASSQPLVDLGLTKSGQPVDLETAKEFMQATLEKIEPVELGAIENELAEKSRRLQALLKPSALVSLSTEQLGAILRTVFATRRRSKEILTAAGPDLLKSSIQELLHTDRPIDMRFQRFVDGLGVCSDDVRQLRPRKAVDSQAKVSAEAAALTESTFCDLGSELLHFAMPKEYWLWTRWIWDPVAGTGAMPLVTMEEVDLYGESAGKTYMKLGVATAFVRSTSEAAGLSGFGSGPFGIDVFLACVYAVYMYTTLRMRMTQEFNQVVPELPELTRRLLGIWKMEI
ncbi:MAG: hypothetical protein ACE5JF_07525 [Anaerolineales bacterium]